MTPSLHGSVFHILTWHIFLNVIRCFREEHWFLVRQFWVQKLWKPPNICKPESSLLKNIKMIILFAVWLWRLNCIDYVQVSNIIPVSKVFEKVFPWHPFLPCNYLISKIQESNELSHIFYFKYKQIPLKRFKKTTKIWFA